MHGRTSKRWPSRPMIVSSVVVFVDFVFITSVIDSDHALYLLVGSDIISCLKSHVHPSIVLISLRLPSARSLFWASV